MMSNVAIHVDQVSKRYRLGTPSGQDRLTEFMHGLGRLAWDAARCWRAQPAAPPQAHRDDLWALRDVSFEVRQGEVVGIIGRNGAGKSTLLKVLSRITEPTSGRFGIRGRVGSLLEVGAGFHPELTGRENVYLNGSFLGMSRREIARKFDDIAAFADIDQFLDTPVKRYSSGMQVRLGFAVAAHLDPDVLIIDEALAVGDAAFQKKCLGKMQEVASSGRTVLFVSHNVLAVNQLCHRAIWLEQGAVRVDSDPPSVARDYLGASTTGEIRTRLFADAPHLLGNEAFRILRARVAACHGEPTASIDMDCGLNIEVETETLNAGGRVTVTLLFLLEDGTVAFGSSLSEEGAVFLPGNLCRSRCEIPGRLLNSGRYLVSLLAIHEGGAVLFRTDRLLEFHVADLVSRAGAAFGRRAGAVWPRLQWRTVDMTPMECAPCR